jgi:HSP20 family molecular chaperone IbpA
MFNSKNCPKCGKKSSEKFDFCPFCGSPLDDNNSWGMLGKNDALTENPFQSPFLNNSIFNKMLGSAMKMLEKEMKKEMKKDNMPKTNFQLYINGKKVNLTPGNVSVKRKPVKKQVKRKYPELVSFSKENQKRFTNLPKEEPATNVRRLADRIIFEINMPEVKSIKDVSIKNLENSIEIKAVTRNKAYYKIIRVGLPVIDYYLDKEKLILELEAKH